MLRTGLCASGEGFGVAVDLVVVCVHGEKIVVFAEDLRVSAQTQNSTIVYCTHCVSHTTLRQNARGLPHLARRDRQRRCRLSLLDLEIIAIGIEAEARVFQHAVLDLVGPEYVAAGETSRHPVSRDAAAAAEVAAEGLYGWRAGGRWDD